MYPQVFVPKQIGYHARSIRCIFAPSSRSGDLLELLGICGWMSKFLTCHQMILKLGAAFECDIMFLQFLFSPTFIGVFLSTLVTLEGRPSQVVPKLQQVIKASFTRVPSAPFFPNFFSYELFFSKYFLLVCNWLFVGVVFCCCR